MTQPTQVHRALPVLLAALVTLGLRTSAQSTPAPTAQVLRFRQDGVCPPNAVPAAKLLQGVRAQQTCSVECSLRPDCAVYGFISSSSECRMGTTEDLLTTWQSPAPPTSCTSQLNPRLPGILSFRSSLIAFLDFRIGKTNLVRSGRFSVSANSRGVTFDSSGAVFTPPVKDGASNFVELNTVASLGTDEAFGDILGRGRKFSVYARVQRLAGKTQNYWLMTDCSGYNKLRGISAHSGGREMLILGLANPDELPMFSTNAGTPEPANQTIDISAGAVFDSNNFTAAYYNGKAMAVGTFTYTGAPSFTGKPECIRLGYAWSASDGMVGRYVCFAIATKALSAQEFAELDALCV